MKFIFKPKWRRFTSAVQIPLTIVLVAFALRVATIVAEHTYQVPIRGRGWYFAYEMGAIAGSVASGRGFRSPFCAACGPTAWVGPIYPLLLAGIFKVFGAYTNLSAFVSLAVNSIFGAVNALVIFHIARDMFDRRVALISAWIWAVLPYAIFWPTHWIWDTSLSALLLSVAFLWTLRLAGETDRAKWFEFGLFWALIALTNASLLSFLPVSVGWLGWHLRRQEVGRGIPIAVLTIAFVVGISPWVIRNYLVFGSLVPLRSDLGEELFAGNHEGGNGLYYEVKRWNLSELQRVGELRFVAERRQMALHFITNHPGDFAI